MGYEFNGNCACTSLTITLIPTELSNLARQYYPIFALAHRYAVVSAFQGTNTGK